MPGRSASASVRQAHVEPAGERAVESRQPGHLLEDGARGCQALLHEVVRHVRHDRVVGVQDVATPVGGGGVDQACRRRGPDGGAGRGRSSPCLPSRNVSMVRRCSAFASRIAHRLAGPQGIRVAGESTTYPPACGRGPRSRSPGSRRPVLTRTSTVSCTSSCGPASVRWSCRAGRRYSYGVKRYAVETVWLQATSLFQPMLTAGEPISEAPATSYRPGSSGAAG